jgi:hypothetical protein
LSPVFQPFPNLSFSCASCNSRQTKKRSVHFVSHQRKEGSKQPTSSYTEKVHRKERKESKEGRIAKKFYCAVWPLANFDTFLEPTLAHSSLWKITNPPAWQNWKKKLQSNFFRCNVLVW